MVCVYFIQGYLTPLFCEHPGYKLSCVLRLFIERESNGWCQESWTSKFMLIFHWFNWIAKLKIKIT